MNRSGSPRRMAGWVLAVAALAGAIACAGLAATASASSLAWSSPQPVDDLGPYGHAPDVSAVSCPTASLCVALTQLAPPGQVLTSTDPTASNAPWKVTQVDTATLDEISCPSASLCAAVDEYGRLVTSTDPSGGAGAWSTPVTIGSRLQAVSCPSATLCVALDASGDAFVSPNPTGGASAWTADGTVPGGVGIFTYLSCPSVSLCVDVDDDNPAVVDTVLAATTDPMTGSAWTVTAIASGHANGPGLGTTAGGLSCPSVNLCVAVDGAGDAIVSTDPAGPQPTWTVSSIDSQPLTGISCPAVTLCVAVDREGGALTSANPASSWTPAANIDPDGGRLPGGASIISPGIDAGDVLQPVAGSPELAGVSCPAVTLCVAVDAFGHALSTSNPTGGPPGWAVDVAASPADALAAMSCPSASLCAALDDVGRVVVSPDPAAAQPSWSVTALPELAAGNDYRIACTARPLCLALDISYTASDFQPVPAYVSTDPAGGVAAWKSLGSLARLTPGPECPEAGLCLDSGGIMAVAPPESAPRRSPAIVPLDPSTSCPSFCIEPYTGGAATPDISIQSHPPNGAWRSLRIDDVALISGVACPTSALCVAYDQGGNILYSTDPTGAASSWTSIHPNLPAPLTRLDCPSASLCVGADDLGDLVTASDPQDPAAWSATLLDPGSVITSLACPSAARCIAGDDSGDVLIGTGPLPPAPAGVSRAAALGALAGALRDSCEHRRIARILAARGCATPFDAPGPGTLVLAWRTASGSLIATGRARAAGGRVTVQVRLSRAGTRLLRRSRRIRVHVSAGFTDAAGHLYTETRVVTLVR